jgi:hypothetical protein
LRLAAEANIPRKAAKYCYVSAESRNMMSSRRLIGAAA